MGPRHNTFHAAPNNAKLLELRKSGNAAVPLVKRAVSPTGEDYYPVFMPFHARVICPWCFQESAISTYPSHTKGPRMCSKFPQEKAIAGTPVSASLYLPPEDVVNVDEDVSDDDNDDQKMMTTFKQFQQFIKIQKKLKAEHQPKKKSNVDKSHGMLESESESSGLGTRPIAPKKNNSRNQPRTKKRGSSQIHFSSDSDDESNGDESSASSSPRKGKQQKPKRQTRQPRTKKGGSSRIIFSSDSDDESIGDKSSASSSPQKGKQQKPKRQTMQQKSSTTTTQPRETRQLKDVPPVPQQHQARTLDVDTDIDTSSDVPVNKTSRATRAKKGPPVDIVTKVSALETATVTRPNTRRRPNKAALDGQPAAKRTASTMAEANEGEPAAELGGHPSANCAATPQQPAAKRTATPQEQRTAKRTATPQEQPAVTRTSTPQEPAAKRTATPQAARGGKAKAPPRTRGRAVAARPHQPPAVAAAPVVRDPEKPTEDDSLIQHLPGGVREIRNMNGDPDIEEIHEVKDD